ncbi:MAG: FKBP-type peptidyl-prolyl cis-trans isomerase, partial [Gammaproteobacteria bacterium]|nr:FKBP-type peptidyl-prolyl cis-trans isomerase [Gammaproteobacteria bacterium]
MSDDTIRAGKYVGLTYTIFDEQENIVEQHDMPIGFVYGSDTELIGGMDKAVAGRRAGDQVEVEVPPEQGFGDHDPSLTFTDDIENVPPQFLQVGAEVQMQNDAGESRSFFVTRIAHGKVTIDGNHP